MASIASTVLQAVDLDQPQASEKNIRVVRGAFLQAAQSLNIPFKKIKRAFGGKLTRSMFRSQVNDYAKKKGRPKGHIVSDKVLKEVLFPLTAPSCRYKADGSEVRTWKSTVFQAYAKNKQVHTIISYSSLCRRIRRSKLNIVKGRKRTDLCNCCRAFDTGGGLAIREGYAKSRAILTNLAPEYFASWDRKVELHSEWSDKEYDYTTDQHYASAYLTYMEEHGTQQLHYRCSLLPECLAALEKKEAEMIEEFRTRTQALVVEFGLHFQLRDVQCGELQRLMRCPAPGVVYIWQDFEELGAGFVQSWLLVCFRRGGRGRQRPSVFSTCLFLLGLGGAPEANKLYDPNGF